MDKSMDGQAFSKSLHKPVSKNHWGRVYGVWSGLWRVGRAYGVWSGLWRVVGFMARSRVLWALGRGLIELRGGGKLVGP
jgi:hypothetical protein